LKIFCPDTDFVIRSPGEEKIIPQVQRRRQDIAQVIICVFTDDVYPARSKREDFRRCPEDFFKGRD
jgi:hypothetical protein